MELLNHYFSERQIVALLAKYRAKLAYVRHNNYRQHQFVEKLSVPESLHNHFLQTILPPRRQWLRPRSHERSQFNDSLRINQKAIENAVMAYRYPPKCHTTKPEWYHRLKAFVADVRATIQQAHNYSINPPKILPVLKEKHDDISVYRPIATFSTYKDRVILSLTARYLTQVLDRAFMPCAYAFRARQTNRKALSHHQAIEDILAYRHTHRYRDFWAAECDIKKFYDSVNHKVVREALDMAVARVAQQGLHVDHRALSVFEAALACYAFNQDVYPKNTNGWFEEQGLQGGVFQWIEQELRQRYDSLNNERIGVAQGSPLSPLIANLILDRVDRMVLQDNANDDLLYIRYCDDMILLHHNKAACEAALNRFKVGLSLSQLFYHDPQPITTYGRNFWTVKSKQTYRWGPKHDAVGNVPWLSFVGYQIRHDGVVRIRFNSLKKEREKQQQEADRLLALLRRSAKEGKGLRRSRGQILYTFHQRLIAMSVGRIKLHDRHRVPTICWASGFRQIKKNPVIAGQLRELDRHRDKQVYRVKQYLKRLPASESNSKKHRFPVHYWGAPFSYYGILNRLKKD